MRIARLDPARRGALAAASHAVAALEFAILAPVMALLLLGVYNLARLAIIWEQVWSASRSIAESATTLANESGAASVIYIPEVNLSLSEIFAQVPWVAAGIANGPYRGTGQNTPNSITAVLSSVNYVPEAGCKATSCPYQQTVEWSMAYVPKGFTGFVASAFRPCIVSTAGAPIPSTIVNTATYSGDPIYAPDPFVIADVSVVVTPYFFNFIVGNVTLSATSYVPVRSISPGAPAAQQFTDLPDKASIPAGTGCSYSPAPVTN
jgi:Flp pilus assembly protein TadG